MSRGGCGAESCNFRPSQAPAALATPVIAFRSAATCSTAPASAGSRSNAGSLFSGPLLIQYISFFNNNFQSGFVDNASYTLELSTTGNSPFNLSPTFSSNLGADHITVFSGTLGGPGSIVNGIFTIPLSTAFTFNPAAGNLLLSVTTTGGTTEIRLGAGTYHLQTR